MLCFRDRLSLSWERSQQIFRRAVMAVCTQNVSPGGAPWSASPLLETNNFARAGYQSSRTGPSNRLLLVCSEAALILTRRLADMSDSIVQIPRPLLPHGHR